MTTEASEGHPRQSLRARIAGHAWSVLITLSAVLMAVGGLPSWAERTIVVVLWGLVVLVCLGMMFAMAAFRLPAPEELRRRGAPARRQRGAVARLGTIARRLLQMVIVVALLLAGRPLLAGFYALAFILVPVFQVSREIWISGLERPDVGTGKWAVYRTVRFLVRLIGDLLRCLVRPIGVLLRHLLRVLRWTLWIPLVAAVAACLFRAGIRLKRPLRRALGLPQALARILYGRPCRALWQTALPTAFWSAATALALWLSLASPAAPVAGAITVLLGTMAAVLLALGALSLLFLLWPDVESSVAHHPRPTGWPRTPGPYLMGLLRLVLLGALSWAGAWGLAGLYLALVCVMAAVAMTLDLETSCDQADEPDTNPFPVIPGAIGLILVVSPFFAVASPFIAIYLAFRARSDMRTARQLRELHARPDGLVYFAYAEPHQREHFLGEGGLLHGWRERVVARDWRREVMGAMSDLGWAGLTETAEGRLLERFEVTNMREDLPFLAVVTGRRLEPFRLGEAYRARRRDGGKALGDLERRVAKRLAKRFAGATS